MTDAPTATVMSFEGGVVLTDPVKPKKKQGSKKAAKAPVEPQKAPQATVGVDIPKEEESTHRITLHKHLRKTRFCMYHFQGACQYGSECSFAHSLGEMHQTPDLRKTQLCKAFTEGGCTDATCTFAHGEDELRSTEMFFKKTLCIWHEKGKCRNGEKCRFAHGVKELRARQAGKTESPGVPDEPLPAQGNERRQKGSKKNVEAMADPMKINFNQGVVGKPPLQTPPVVPNVGKSSDGSNLNGELATLCQSIAILTAQCNNIQKRMELEQEYSNIQRHSESMGMSAQGLPMPGQVPMYPGFAGQLPGVGPFPPGLNGLPGVPGGMPQMAPGMVDVLQSMPQLTPAMAEVLQNMKNFY